MSLRSKLIKLARENPELREEILPLLKEAAHPAYSTWNELKKDVEERSSKALMYAEELSFMLQADWSAYKDEQGAREFISTARDAAQAVRSLGKVRDAWVQFERKMR